MINIEKAGPADGSAFLDYYNGVLLCNFLTTMTNSGKYIEKILDQTSHVDLKRTVEPNLLSNIGLTRNLNLSSSSFSTETKSDFSCPQESITFNP